MAGGTPKTEKSAYEILGLPKSATFEEVKAAYFTLVKKYDPEKHTERFMEIDKAFQRLKDPVKRAKEDVTTFNSVKGEFFFNKEEMSNAPDVQIEQAIQLLERKKAAGEIQPADADPKLVQGFMIRSFKKVQKKLWAEAIQDWQRVLKLDPANRRAKANLLYSYQTLGYSYAIHGLNDEAVEVWTQAAQMNPDDVNILHNLALASERAGMMSDAGRYWAEVQKRWKTQLDQEPDNDYLKNLMIELLREHSSHMPGNEGAAGSAPAAPHAAPGAPGGHAAPAHQPPPPPQARGINEYREILKLNPNDFEARFKVANQLMAEHKWDEAYKELEELRGKFPRNIEVLNLLGWALLNSGRIDDSFMMWQKARVLDPKNAEVTQSIIKARMSLGRQYRDKGLYTPSLVQFKALSALLPNNDEVTYEIAKTFHLKGDERAAFQEYNKVLKLNPKHKEARHGLSTLKMRR